MPFSIEWLEPSAKEENVTLVLGRTIILKIVEDVESTALLNDRTVKRLVSIKNLCSDHIRLLVDRIIAQDQLLTSPAFFERIEPAYSGKLLELPERPSGVKSQYYQEIKDMVNELMFDLFGKVDNVYLVSKDKELLSMHEELGKRTGIGILVPYNILVCPNCNLILSREEFETTKECKMCGKEIRREEAKRIFIHKVLENIKKVWKSNLWFEAYIAGLLRKLGWRTWVGVHVMGSSGVLHEVDVLAIRNGTVLVAECKTGKVSRNHVFNFCTKVNDLRAHVSILALIQELPEPETREFVKKNPMIIRLENMGRLQEVHILNDLENRLSVKA